ncbi:MAG: hypothetical protein RL594_1307 [Bacteroidota bacterium]|jgi:hypothetical protein
MRSALQQITVFASAIWLCVLAMVITLPGTTICQPLANPYTFAIDQSTDLDTTFLGVTSEVAGARGRVVLTKDGHLGFADGSRLRLVGTGMQWFSAMPDSANAIVIARRLRALGINAVRLNTFDISVWPATSIFRAGTASTLQDGLDPVQMRKFDWFMHQLRQHGIYYVFTFQSTWTPRPGDGVLQPDSTGWGARVPVIFNQRLQQIHRDIVRAVLTHVNPFTELAYKDDPALAYVIAAEDASVAAFWLYTDDVVRPNPNKTTTSSGSQHVAHIDSLWNAWLSSLYKTDATLSTAWTTNATTTQNLVQNGDFEDPFNNLWIMSVNSTTGAQAILQYSDAEKQQGATSARVRINKLDPSRTSFMIQLVQRLPVMRHLQSYQLSFWAKTTPQRGSRDITLYVFNGTPPYNSYGLAQAQRINAEWKKYTYTFTATVSDSSTPALGFFLGADSGDVFIDDVQFREVSVNGMRNGESLTKRNIRMSTMLDGEITVGRSKDNARFVYENLRRMFQNFRLMVRDTLASSVLLCPSTRFVSFYEIDAVREYDVFSSIEYWNYPTSQVADPYGAYMVGHAQVRPVNKAFVLSHVSIQFPSPYASEMMAYYPAYAGLQDWDGVFFSVFSDNGLVGASSIDSNDYFMLRTKPNLLSVLPWTSSLMRRGAVAPSPKELLIDHTPETVALPRLTIQSPFGLAINTDPRIPLFRRVAVNTELKEQASFMPHLEVSALSGEVDLAAMDAENGQIFRDATKSIMRIETPTHAAVMGPLTGQIITLGSHTIEQTTTAQHALIALSSSTDKPLGESSAMLLTISTRALNQGATFDAANQQLVTWGKGPVQMEGVGVRFSFAAPKYDSLVVQPLGSDGKPLGSAFGVSRRSGGRFAGLINTAEHKTPWYRLEFLMTSSVEQEMENQILQLVNNPITDGRAELYVREPVRELSLVDITGRVVELVPSVDGKIMLNVSRLPAGWYRVVARRASGATVSTSMIIQ